MVGTVDLKFMSPRFFGFSLVFLDTARVWSDGHQPAGIKRLGFTTITDFLKSKNFDHYIIASTSASFHPISAIRPALQSLGPHLQQINKILD